VEARACIRRRQVCGGGAQAPPPIT
jgi:hypothetical protein